MGEYADMAIEAELNAMMDDEFLHPYYELGLNNKKSKPKKFQWKTANGEILVPKDMTTSHIQNSIKLCERRQRDGDANAIEHFKKELKRRGQ